MSGSAVTNGLMVFFAITTVAVFLYPIVKLAPSWRERSRHRKIVLHRQVAVALDERNRAALNALVPGEAVALQEPAREIDAAA